MDEVETTYQEGLAAQREGRHLDAINLFERVVLINPRHAGAWLDLAISYARAGDSATARNLLRHVESEFKPGPEVRQAIAALRASMVVQPVATTQPRVWRGEVSAALGRGNNINSAPGIDAVTLTLGDQRVDLLLADSQRPVNAPYLANDLLLTWTPGGEWKEWEGLLNVNGRLYPSEGQWNLVSGMAGLSRTWAQSPGAERYWNLAAFVQHVRFGASALQSSVFVTGRQVNRLGACRGSLGTDLERKAYPADALLNSTAISVKGGLECPGLLDVVASPWMPHEFRTELRVGTDYPAGDRPGGAQSRTELSLQATHRLAIARLDYSFYLGHYADRSGYSPLLENNASRRNQRRSMMVSLSREILPQLEGFVQAQVLRQSSNLPVFNADISSIQAGARWKF